MKTIMLKFVGKSYRSYDDGLQRPIAATPMTEHEVSVPKADQLLRDFPRDWQVADVVPTEPQAQETIPAPARELTPFHEPPPPQPAREKKKTGKR
jgi:hypothetical protein